MSTWNIKKEIAKHSDNKSVSKTCFFIIDFMEKTKTQELKMITFPTLLEVLNISFISSDLLLSLILLTNKKLNILDRRAIFYSPTGDEYDLSQQELENAEAEGSIPDPKDGSLIYNYQDYLSPYFAASEKFLKATHHE